MPASGEACLAVRAALDDGGSATVPLEPIAALPPAEPAAAANASLAICMATWEPDPELFAIQVESIRAQSDDDWICLISDDCSGAEGFAAIEQIVGDDPRFIVSRSPRRRGFYRNFERALGMVPEGVELVALSDQDDRWYPEKLATLRGRARRCAARLQRSAPRRPGGEVIAASYWGGPRTRNDTNFASLLIANTITGAASLFRRELLDVALPFPDVPGTQYQDHWLGLCALPPAGSPTSTGRSTTTSSTAARCSATRPRTPLGEDGPPPSGLKARFIATARGSRAAYFNAFCRLRVLAATLLLRIEPGRLRSGPAASSAASPPPSARRSPSPGSSFAACATGSG